MNLLYSPNPLGFDYMEWHACPDCQFRHPFKVPIERGCPNKAAGLKTKREFFDYVAGIAANKPVNKPSRPVNKPALVNKPVPLVNKVPDRLTYMRDYMRKRREAKKPKP